MKISNVPGLVCFGIIVICSLGFARGEVLPPPYGAGLGNAEDWMPGGSLFGFDDPFGDGGPDGGGHGYGGFGWGVGGGIGRRDRDHLPNGGLDWSHLLGGGGGAGWGGGSEGNGGSGESGGFGGGGSVDCAECLKTFYDDDAPRPGVAPLAFYRNVCSCWVSYIPATAKVGDLITGYCSRNGDWTISGNNYGCCRSGDCCQRPVGQ